MANTVSALRHQEARAPCFRLHVFGGLLNSLFVPMSSSASATFRTPRLRTSYLPGSSSALGGPARLQLRLERSCPAPVPPRPLSGPSALLRRLMRGTLAPSRWPSSSRASPTYTRSIALYTLAFISCVLIASASALPRPVSTSASLVSASTAKLPEVSPHEAMQALHVQLPTAQPFLSLSLSAAPPSRSQDPFVVLAMPRPSVARRPRRPRPRLLLASVSASQDLF